MKISTKNGSDSKTVGNVYYYAGSAVNGTLAKADYGVFAMKIKIQKTDMQPGKVALQRKSGGGWKGMSTLSNATESGQGYSYEYGNGDWQLVTFAAATDSAVTHWDGVAYELTSDSTGTVVPELYDGTAETLAYVQWAGVFENEEAAKAYFNSTTTVAAKIEKSSLFFYGGLPLSSNYYCGIDSRFMGVIADTNSAAVYDATENAYKISTLAGNTTTANLGAFHAQHDGTWNGKEDKLSEYPYFAIAVKTNGTNLGAPTVQVATNSRNSGWQTVSLGNYAETTDWQLLVGSAPKGGDSYNGFKIASFTNNASIIGDGSAAVDLGWIKWGGLFKTEADAQEYFYNTFPGSRPTLPSTTPSSGSTTPSSEPTTTTTTKPVDFYYSYKTEEDFNTHVGQELPDQSQDKANLPENLVETNRDKDSVKYIHHTFAYEWGLNAAGNTILSYDKEVGAMKVSAKAKFVGNDQYVPGDAMEWVNQPGKINIVVDNDVNVTMGEYPIFAIKIKLANKDYKYADTATLVNTVGDKAQDFGAITVNTNKDGYQATTDWQLLTIKVNNTEGKYTNTNWRAVMLSLLPSNVTSVEANQEIAWIEWAGAFKSVDDAQKHFEETSKEPDTPVQKPEVDFFFDFKDGANIQSEYDSSLKENHIAVKKDSNTAIVYDAENKALKISTVAGYTDLTGVLGRVQYYAGTDVADTVSTSEYGFFAMKIKMLKNNFTPGRGASILEGKTFKGISVVNSTESEFTSKQGYWWEPFNDEWQLVIFSAAAQPQIAAWNGFAASLADETRLEDPSLYDGTPEDLALVEWAGVFKSEKEAQDYFNATTQVTPEADNLVKPGNTFWDFRLPLKSHFYQEFDSRRIKATDGANSEISYDYINNALKITSNGTTSKSNIGSVDIKLEGTRQSSPTWEDVNPKDYPVAAFKMKLLRDDLGTPAISGYFNGAGSGLGNLALTYGEPDEDGWMLVYCDTQKTSGIWGGFKINFITGNAGILKEGEKVDLALLQWAGVFKTVRHAENYYKGLPDPDAPSTGGDGEGGEGGEGGSTVEKPPFFVDLSSEALYMGESSRFRANGSADANSKFEYDKELGAVKITAPKDINTNVGSMIFFPGDAEATMDDYPFFAALVKLNKDYTKAMAPSVGLFAAERGGSWRAGLIGLTTYNESEDWQLLIFRGSQTNPQFTGNWNGAMINLINDGETVTAGDTVGWVKWGGAFKTLADVYAYAGMDPDGVEAPSDIFWKFTTEDAVKDVEALGDTNISYDIGYGAMKIEATDKDSSGFVDVTPGRITLGSKKPIAGNYKTSDYPYLAFRVRIDKRDLEGGGVYVRSTGTVEKKNKGTITSADQMVATVDYQDMTNWQTLIFKWDDDTMLKFFFDGDWQQIQYNAFSSMIGSALEGDAVWMRWAGAFKSLEDIEAYVAATKDKEVGDTADGGLIEDGGEGDGEGETTTTTESTTTTEEETTTTEEETTTTEEETTPTDGEIDDSEDVVYVVTNVPYVGENGNWWIGDVDTGIVAEEGVEPYIGENGTWWIGDVDTEILVEYEIYVEEEYDDDPPAEDEPDLGENAVFPIVIAVLVLALAAMLVLFSQKKKTNE